LVVAAGQKVQVRETANEQGLCGVRAAAAWSSRTRTPHPSRHGLPTVFTAREYAEAGGLMSYGTSLPGAFRMTGLYTGRILKGAKPRSK
jgi:hypothetical protein